jgi:outer membrane lipoprotein-sorting protein
MTNKYSSITAITIFLFLQGLGVILFRGDPLRADITKEVDKKLDGQKVMKLVSERDRGKDYIITTSWKLLKNGKIKHTMKYTEIRKLYGGKDGFNYKSVIRYSEPPRIFRRAILTWNYQEGKRLFWYFALNFRDAKKVTNTERIRPQAEADFSLADYVDINLEEESHRLLRSEEYEGKACYVVESTPVKKQIKYGKRISWIDQKHWTPLKIEYFDKNGARLKVLDIKWQNKSGLWFWEKAVAENVQDGYKTFITVGDVKVNPGLNDREFTKVALERKK